VAQDGPIYWHDATRRAPGCVGTFN